MVKTAITGGKKDSRSRQERRRETGEDFTPIPLVNEMLDHLPAEVWTNPNKTFLDPSCGDGNFLVEVKKRLLAAGHSEENALSRIFGIDIMHDNVVAACERLGVDFNKNSKWAVSRTIVCADTLKYDTNEKLAELFDRVGKSFHVNLLDELKKVVIGLKAPIRKLPKGDERKELVSAYKKIRRLVKALSAD